MIDLLRVPHSLLKAILFSHLCVSVLSLPAPHVIDLPVLSYYHVDRHVRQTRRMSVHVQDTVPAAH